MTVDSGVRVLPSADADRVPARWLVLLSAACLALQVSRTDYGEGPGGGGGGLWLALGLLLLWLVYRRRSRVARGVVVVTSLAGAVVYSLGALQSTDAALLSMAFLGQALPLLTGPVRRHVQPPR